MVLTVSFVISLVTGLSCHHRLGNCLHRLDASVGASGPHDFAVRDSIIRPRARARLTLPRPSHPAPNVRDDRETPLVMRRGTARVLVLIWPDEEAKYFFAEDWTGRNR